MIPRRTDIENPQYSRMDSCVFIAMRAGTIGSSPSRAKVVGSALPAAVGEWRIQPPGSWAECCPMLLYVSGSSRFPIRFDTAVPGTRGSRPRFFVRSYAPSLPSSDDGLVGSPGSSVDIMGRSLLSNVSAPR